jgi:hypothetical protein
VPSAGRQADLDARPNVTNVSSRARITLRLSLEASHFPREGENLRWGGKHGCLESVE